MSENINQTQDSQGKTDIKPMNYALWGDRALAALIDIGIAILFMVVIFVVLWIIGFILSAISGGLISTETEAGGIVGILGIFGCYGICCVSFILPPVSYLVIGLLNKVYWVSKRGYSIGQGLMKLRVVDANENFISMGTATLRLFCQIGLGFIPVIGPMFDLVYPLFDDPTRQTLHDKAVGTFVIKTDEPPDFFPKKSSSPDFNC